MASRNRPRASFAKEDIADEQNLWGSIVEKVKRCHVMRQKIEAVNAQIIEVESKMKSETLTAKESLSHLDTLNTLHREGLRLTEEESAILTEEPEDLIRNLDTLISVRSAFETELPVKPHLSNKPRNVKRAKLDIEAASKSPAPQSEVSTPVLSAAARGVGKGASRSGSVAAGSAKSENGGEVEVIKPVAQGKESKLIVGAEVLHRKKNAEGAGILCKITKIMGEGKQRRYDVQDVDPAEHSIDRVGPHVLSPIPAESTPPAEIPKGHQVLAVYPETTTFYRAEIVSIKKDGLHYRLRFEGEEERGMEQEVSRRYVLDVKF